jgi:gas vesicle protein
MSRVSVIFGALAGMAAGALFGILFAPDKGTETRKKIVHQGEDYVDDLKERINSILNNGSKHREKVKESA